MGNIVKLDADHPGFKDKNYRKRRNRIAALASMTESEVPLVDYTKKEHQVWAFVFKQLSEKSKKYAYRSHLQYVKELKLNANAVPQVREVNKLLMKKTGFRMVPVAGLVKPRLFLESLGNGVFLCTQYVRHHSKPGFTPEPDILHEIIGHAPQLINPTIAKITREIGKAAQRADEKQIKQLERLYWFTIEYGVCKEKGKLKAYGAGNLSSFVDLERSTSQKVKHVPFDIRKVVNTSYDPTKHQPVLFVVSSFNDALRQIRKFCSSIN